MADDEKLIAAMAKALTEPQQELALDALIYEQENRRPEFPLIGANLVVGRGLADKGVMKTVSENRRIFAFTPRGRLVAEYVRRNATPNPQ